MKHIIPIYEFIKNINNLVYIVNKFKDELSKLLENDDEYYIEDYNKNYIPPALTIYRLKILFIKEHDTLKVEKLLQKYVNIFRNNELFLTFKKEYYTYRNNKNYYKYDCVIKSDMLFRSKPTKFLYHVSPISNRENILKEGLKPSTGQWDIYLAYNPAIFATKDINNLFTYRGKEFSDIWQIDTTNLSNNWWVDLNINKLVGADHNNYIMTYEPIPPENLSLFTKKQY